MGTLAQAFNVTRGQMLAHFGDTPQCDGCRHLRADGFTCDAFPEEIPGPIFINDFDHHHPFAGDHGVRFEPKDAESQRADNGGGFGAIFSGLAGAQLVDAEPSKEPETRAAADEKGSYEAGSDKRHEAAVKAAASRGAGKGDKEKSKESRERAERAKATYRVSDKLAQDQGDKRAHDVATWTGLKLTGDNEPMDAVARTARGQMCGIEVKCLTRQSNDKITMHPESLTRKNNWAKKNRANTFTVVIDDRDTFEGGKHVDKFSGHQIYMQRGFGSFRLGSMVKIASTKQLRDIVRGKKKLSDVAEVSE